VGDAEVGLVARAPGAVGVLAPAAAAVRLAQGLLALRGLVAARDCAPLAAAVGDAQLELAYGSLGAAGVDAGLGRGAQRAWLRVRVRVRVRVRL